MDIIQPEYRKNVLSNCCGAKIYENTDECRACLEHCSFIIENPIAFHQWLLVESKHDRNKLIDLLRSEIIENQNPQVFELMDLVDMGESQYGMNTIIRVSDMLFETKHTTTIMDQKETKVIPINKTKKQKNEKRKK